MSSENSNTETLNTTTSNGDIDLIKDSLEKAGKTKEEIDAVSTINEAQDAADSERAKLGVMQEAFLAPTLDLRLFASQALSQELVSSQAAETLSKALAAGLKHRDAGTLFGEDGKVNPQVIADLAEAGYWGLPIPKEYGGSGASKFFCGRAMVTMGSNVAEVYGGLLSIERLIGAAGPLIWKGTKTQKENLLRPLAAGHVRSGFGGTEPSVGCNITKASTYGVVDGDDIIVYGEKLFISNAWYGHVIALLLKIDNKLRVLITQLPDEDSEEFHIVNYGIHALRQIHNKGIYFNGLRVPKANLLDGDGLAIIFHDLDEGRFAVAATASARMRKILSSCIPWVKGRETFGEKLETREYIRFLMALQAAYIVGSEALVDWSASLIDSGYQGDVSSMITKTQATDWLRHSATELGMFTHGGRFVLKGHIIGDNLADDMVSSVYEGPNPMLGKACIKSMGKVFIDGYLKPLMVEFANAGIEIGKLRFTGAHLKGTLAYLFANRGKLLKNRKPIVAKVIALLKFLKMLRAKPKGAATFEGLDSRFVDHLHFAEKSWFKWRKQFVSSMLIYQERLADQDILMLEGVYQPMANITTMFCAIAASRAAKAAGDEATVAAFNLLCWEMRTKLSGEKRTSGAYKKAVHETAQFILNGQMRQLNNVPTGEILQPYGIFKE
jgi:butyryl-CoA dehydrogenase